MVLVEFRERLSSADTRKRQGKPTYYGERNYSNSYYGKEHKKIDFDEYGKIFFGNRFFGESRTYEGIYQTRHYTHGKYTVQEKFYTPTQAYHAGRQAWRAVFADAVTAWQNLTASQKEIYRVKCSGKHMSGYNVFLHEYLISH